MSRAAYESFFGVTAPAGAVFGVDISWFQGYDYGLAHGYWSDFAGWADFICVRVSYGSSGDDGAQALHFQLADDFGYTKPIGPYHFVHSGPSTWANADNYLRRSAPFLERTSFDMLDFEAAPVASGAYISELCDMVEQARQRPCILYSGKGYIDQAGAISCPAAKFWTAHYAPAGSNPWVPTTDWSSWNAPLMPNQMGGEYPGVWQWSSFTAQHGHLDLNISTTPDLFGGADTGELTMSQYDDLMARIGQLETGLVVRTDLILKGIKKCRMISARGAWWLTDFVGVVPIASPEVVVNAQQLGYLDNDVDGAGNPIPQGCPDALFDTLIRYDLKAAPAPPIVDVAASLRLATVQQLLDALKAKVPAGATAAA